MTSVPTVVLVDDNPGDIELVRMAFEQQHLEVDFRSASSGPEAFYMLRHLASLPASQMPNLLLLDLNMPGINGFQLLGYIRTQPALHNLKVLMLSSTCRPKDQTRALELGASAYLVKPLDWPSYADLVEQLRPYLEVGEASSHGTSAAGPHAT